MWDGLKILGRLVGPFVLVQFVKKCPNKRPTNLDELDSCVLGRYQKFDGVPHKKYCVYAMKMEHFYALGTYVVQAGSRGFYNGNESFPLYDVPEMPFLRRSHREAWVRSGRVRCPAMGDEAEDDHGHQNVRSRLQCEFHSVTMTWLQDI